MLNKLKAFDTVSTPNGKGILISQDALDDCAENRNFLVVILQEDLVNKTCVGPCLHLWFKLEELGPVSTEEVRYDKRKSRSGYVPKKKFLDNVKEIFDVERD
jgi:hypothetical protein